MLHTWSGLVACVARGTGVVARYAHIVFMWVLCGAGCVSGWPQHRPRPMREKTNLHTPPNFTRPVLGAYNMPIGRFHTTWKRVFGQFFGFPGRHTPAIGV